MINIQKFLAKSISYAILKRKLNNVIYIAIHNTGNNNDTAWNNAKYFATSNTRQAGAHFFVDQKGNIVQSIEMDRTAYAVGAKRPLSTANGASTYWRKCTNANSVSIELCDIVSKQPSAAMIASTLELVKYIQLACPNAKTIVRHWDVTGKDCPMQFINASKWIALQKQIDPAQVEPYGEKMAEKKMKCIVESYVRTSPEVKQNKVAYSTLSDAMKKRCRKSKDGYAVFKGGSTFTRIRSWKDKDNNTWKQMKSGYWIPSYYKGEKRVESI